MFVKIQCTFGHELHYMCKCWRCRWHVHCIQMDSVYLWKADVKLDISGSVPKVNGYLIHD